MGLEHIHAHFANLPTTLAMLASKLSSCTFSFSTHARDIYIPPSFFSNKFDLAEFIITCNKYNRRYLLNHFDGKYSDKIHRVYHGLDTKKYSSNHRAASSIDALEILFIKSETRPLVLSVGRLEKKKGQTYLLEACNLLKERGIDFVCCIAGDGSEKYSLIDQIYALNLRDVVHLPGALDEDSILNLYKRADVFALPCIQTNDGDHDGLPNVLIEALAMEVAVVTTEVGAIPELIEHEKTGILIPERNVAALAESLQYLIENDERRVQLAVRGREKVCKYFNIKNNIDPLIALFQRD
jgi:glycosyltransferase involved in cell wall biosynthesis